MTQAQQPWPQQPLPLQPSAVDQALVRQPKALTLIAVILIFFGLIPLIAGGNIQAMIVSAIMLTVGGNCMVGALVVSAFRR